jgi:hypothetical protein
MRYGQKRKLLLVIHESSFRAQTVANAFLVEVNEEFRTQGQEQSCDAFPSLSAAVVAAVTRNPWTALRSRCLRAPVRGRS